LAGSNSQEIDDGKLEFYTFSNLFELGCEKVIGGGYAKKIHQSTGPFLLKFKPIIANSVADKEQRIYLKVDGEHYHIVNPRELKISLHSNYPKGTIKFLAQGMNN